jgi:hypothetical protein
LLQQHVFRSGVTVALNFKFLRCNYDAWLQRRKISSFKGGRKKVRVLWAPKMGDDTRRIIEKRQKGFAVLSAEGSVFHFRSDHSLGSEWDWTFKPPDGHQKA